MAQLVCQIVEPTTQVGKFKKGESGVGDNLSLDSGSRRLQVVAAFGRGHRHLAAVGAAGAVHQARSL